MAYSEADIRRVVETTDLVALVGESVALKRVGRRYSGLCPFHSENTPSFSVNGHDGVYYCFGCHAKGDAITFIRELHRVGFAEAVETLAARAGIQLEVVEVQREVRDSRQRLYAAYDLMCRRYRENLDDPARGVRGREYLLERGISLEAMKAFQIGYAHPSQSVQLQRLGLSSKEWEEGGLGYVAESGECGDHMRGRVIFPIRDSSGRVVAFGGRILPEELERLSGKAPKYKNSGDSPIYHKRRVLYNLDRARSEIVKLDSAVVCEGYTDVIGLWQMGVRNAVATCGTAFSEEHLDVLRRFTRNVVLMFDADKAGQNAAERLWEFEERYGMQLSVAVLEEGMDPADAARKDPEMVTAALAEVIPMTRFRLNRLVASHRTDSPEGRAAAAKAAVELIGRHPNPLVRSEYLAWIADVTGYAVGELWRQVRHREQPRGGGPVARASEGDRPSLEALRLLVHDPDEVGEVVVRELFRDPVNLRLAAILSGAGGKKKARELVDASGDEEVRELYYRLANAPSEMEGVDVVTTLVIREAGYELDRTVREIKLRGATGDLAELAGGISRIKLQLQELSSDRSNMEVLGQLISWLVERRRVVAGVSLDSGATQ